MHIFRTLPSGSIAAAISLLCFTLPLPAAAQSIPVPVVSARSWTVYDPANNRMLASSEPDLRVIPASLTKVMTAYLVFEALKEKRIALNQMMNVSLNAYRVDKSSSKMYIDPKVPVSIDDLLHGLIIQSGNDAAVQLAEAVSGSEDVFAALMNKKAQQLGMKNSNFQNASGLPGAQHYSSAADLAILAARVINDFPEEFKIYSIKEFTYNNIKQGNRNMLLYTDATVDGMKTGYVHGSGYNLIATAKRPTDAGMYRVISVVTGSTSPRVRAEDAQKLLSWGFANFENTKLATRNEVVGTPAVWKGAVKSVKVGFADDRFETIARGTAAKIKKEVVLDKNLMAPLAKGTKVGVQKVTYDGKPLMEVPVVALEDVPQSGFFARMWDTIRLRFNWA